MIGAVMSLAGITVETAEAMEGHHLRRVVETA